MEFVAGISHELRTPLAVIQSTSYNLSKGMITDGSRVRQYGEVIQNESRRLINQVEQMLSFAGIQSGRQHYDLRPAGIESIIESVLAQNEPAFAAAGWKVEHRISQNLPMVLLDDQAMTRTVDVHVGLLRQKLEDDPTSPRHLLTVRGHGYKFASQDDEDN